jgi:hypothetical protein
MLDEDPIEYGLATSFNRPGGNVTGVTFLTANGQAAQSPAPTRPPSDHSRLSLSCHGRSDCPGQDKRDACGGACTGASRGRIEFWKFAGQNAIARFRPRTYPAWARAPKKARLSMFGESGGTRPAASQPITGIAGCCARAVSGQTAAPPREAMNSRRRRQMLICPSCAGNPTRKK